MNVEVKPAAPAYKLLIEKDVDVPMRDGARLKADVFRPDDGGRFPAILNLGPYQKDKLWVPPANLEEKSTPSMNWETVTPEWWVPKGYAAVRVDGRGSGRSPGQCEPWSLAEAVDFYGRAEAIVGGLGIVPDLLHIRTGRARTLVLTGQFDEAERVLLDLVGHLLLLGLKLGTNSLAKLLGRFPNGVRSGQDPSGTGVAPNSLHSTERFSA